MRVLITGATGFIGSHITRAVVQQGYEVVAYDYLPTISRIADIKDKIKLVRGDVCDLEILAATMKEHCISHIVHLAYFLPEHTIVQNPTKAIRINLEGTNNVFEAARITGVERVVYATSDAVCPLGVEEDSPVRPLSIYGHMKHFNEVMGRHFANKLGVDTIGVRFGLNYGPGGRLLAGELERRYASAEVLHFIERIILTKKAITSISPGTEFTWQYVKDNARMVSLALQGSKTGRKIFDVPGERCTIGDVSKIIARLLPGAEPRFEGDETLSTIYFLRLQIEGIQTDVTDWTELIWGDDKESVIREMEISALLKKGSSQYGDTGSISFLNHTQEGREEIDRGLEEELPLRIESGLLNSLVQQNN